MSRVPRLLRSVPWLQLALVLTSACGGELGSLHSSQDAPQQEGAGLEAPEQQSDSLACRGPSCPVYAIRASAGAEQPLEGEMGGAPFAAVCREDQVLIGIRALVADDLWGLGVNCGSLELSPTDTGYELSVLPLDQLSLFGGNGIEPTPPLVEYTCPPQMVVTGVSWTWWQPFVSPQQVIKQMQLTCSQLLIGPGRQLRTGSATALLSAGMMSAGMMSAGMVSAGMPGESLAPVQQTCGEQGAVSGFTGRSGGAIDALSTSCVVLSIDAD